MLIQLALKDEMERDYISKFERGVLEPALHVLCAYGEAANVFLDVLVKDDLDLPKTLPAKIRSEGIERKERTNRK
jgi:transcriptional regulator with XRE-family HTH domain